MRLLIESAIDYAIFTMTPGGVIDCWNPGAERMFGYPRRRDHRPQRRRSCSRRKIGHAGVFAEELRTAPRRTDAPSDERYHLRHDGERFYCSGVTIRLGADGELGFAKIARDLTVAAGSRQSP